MPKLTYYCYWCQKFLFSTSGAYLHEKDKYHPPGQIFGDDIELLKIKQINQDTNQIFIDGKSTKMKGYG